MTEPAYPAARAVAATIKAHFARHLAAARAKGEDGLAAQPDTQTIEEIIDAAFWASLRREEGYAPKISLALLPPEQAGQPLMFEQRLPLYPAALTRLAPAVERPGIHLGVWRYDGQLFVWGTTRAIPGVSFVLEVVQPGLLVIKYRRGQESAKYVNIAVLEGDQIKVVDEQGTSLPDCPDLLKSLLRFDATTSGVDSVNVLVQLAVSMRAHGKGGLLLVVPNDAEEWRESIVHPILYSVSPSFSELAELMQQEPGERKKRLWREAFIDSVDAMAGLTAVDGATIINDQYELLAFGAKIARRKGSPQIEQVVLTEPIMDSVATNANPTQLGGTRHLSAAQFVHDQRGALALVASQDGHFTVFAWSPCEEMVHAHRVEALLL
jgi:hypothetical protein